MAERQQYVGEAGRFKKDPAAVSDPQRVDAIIARVRADAAAQNLDPTVAEETFRAMIAAFEAFERAEWTARQAQPGKWARSARIGFTTKSTKDHKGAFVCLRVLRGEFFRER